MIWDFHELDSKFFVNEILIVFSKMIDNLLVAIKF